MNSPFDPSLSNKMEIECLREEKRMNMDENGERAALLHLGRKLKGCGYRFTTVTPATHERVNSRASNDRARDLAGIFGWSRRFDSHLVPSEMLSLMKDAKIVDMIDGEMRSLVCASTIGENLYFHSAYPTSEPDAVFLVRILIASLMRSSKSDFSWSRSTSCD